MITVVKSSNSNTIDISNITEEILLNKITIATLNSDDSEAYILRKIKGKWCWQSIDFNGKYIRMMASSPAETIARIMKEGFTVKLMTTKELIDILG